MKIDFIEILKYLLGAIAGGSIGTLIGVIKVAKWQTNIDFRVAENEKDIGKSKIDIKNIENKFVDCVKKDDLKEIKETLTKMNDKIFEIAKKMPVK